MAIVYIFISMKNYEILNTYGKRQSIDNSKEITQILELSDKDQAVIRKLEKAMQHS